MDKLIYYHPELVIVEHNNKWYIPDKTELIELKSKDFIVFHYNDIIRFLDYKKDTVFSNNDNEKIISTSLSTNIQYSEEFDVFFAYIQEAGIIGIA